jgi:hypothetical protein
MKLLNISFVTAIAVAGLICVQAPSAVAAVAMHTPSAGVASSVPVTQTGYYYYHGRRYPYRYHGMYFNHRYYRGGRYHYY